MITLAIYETPQEFETLKARAKAGEIIYTTLDKKTVLLLDHITARKVNKRELDNLIGRFPLDEVEEEAKTEVGTAEASLGGAGSPQRDETAVQAGDSREPKTLVYAIKEAVKTMLSIPKGAQNA